MGNNEIILTDND